MLHLATILYACVLCGVAAIPLRYFPKYPQAFLGGALAYVAAAVAGLALFILPTSIVGANLFSNFLLLAVTEEIARGVLLYQSVLKWENRLPQRALFGATFGWMEFLFRSYGNGSLESCQRLVSPLSCPEGLPYLAIGSAEVILFHITVTAVGYRDATNLARLLISVVCAAAVHAVYNTIKFLPVWGDDNLLIYVVIPSVLIASYVLAFFVASRTDALGRETWRQR